MSAPQSTGAALRSSRFSVSPGLVTIGTATVLLFVVSALLDGASVSLDLPVRDAARWPRCSRSPASARCWSSSRAASTSRSPGGISLAVVTVTHVPDGDSAKLLPGGRCWPCCSRSAAGVAQRRADRRRWGSTPIIATLGTNALLYGVNLSISGGRPRITTRRAGQRSAAARTLGVPHSVFFALAALAVVAVLVKTTVAGRRFEAIGANAAHGAGGRPAGPDAPLALLRLGPAALLPRRHPDRRHHLAAHRLLRRHASCCPRSPSWSSGGTSLLGGRGFPLPTVIAAVFLQQLIQLVSVLGVSPAISPLVQAAALAVGVSLYTVNWSALVARRRDPTGRSRRSLSAGRRPRPRTSWIPHQSRTPLAHPPDVAGTGRPNVARSRAQHRGEADESISRQAAAAVLSAATASSMSGGLRQRRRRRRQRRRRPGHPGRGRPLVVRHQEDHPRACSTASAATAGAWSPPRRARTRRPSAPASPTSSTPTARATPRRRSPTSRAWSSSGVDAMVVFPDAGKAVLPALTAAYKAGVVTVPYRVDPGGEAGANYDKWIGDDFANDGNNWATWIKNDRPRRRQHPLPRRSGRQQPEHHGVRDAAQGPAGLLQVHRPDAVPAHQLGPDPDPAAAHRRHREVPQDRRHRLRLRPDAGQLAPAVRQERSQDARRWPPRTATR